MSTGQLFSRTTQALFYNYKQSPVQRMLDFDFLCGREIPSVAGVINPGSEGFQKLFFGQEEIAVPVHASIASACKLHPTADVFINFASFRSAFASTMDALKQPTIRVVAVIAEGVPEADAKKLIAYARANNKVDHQPFFTNVFRRMKSLAVVKCLHSLCLAKSSLILSS
jgi:ATP citrate (pro-S)-lyase